jgi:hypothetical protein
MKKNKKNNEKKMKNEEKKTQNPLSLGGKRVLGFGRWVILVVFAFILKQKPLKCLLFVRPEARNQWSVCFS